MNDQRLGVVVPAFNEPGIEATLQALYDQSFSDPDVIHVIVDNGSTDNTRELIDRFLSLHDDFPARVIEEDEKGTGAASDTGVLEAMRQGAQLVARTDADTLPTKNWTQTIVDRFAGDGDLRLLGGKSIAAKDEFYRSGDDILMPLAVRSARIALAIRHFNTDYLRVVVGHNMATDAETYEETGGFERTALDDEDEDITYSLKVLEQFGKDSVRIDQDLIVASSMRRVRAYGVARTALHHLFPSRRGQSGLDIDIR